MVKMKRTDATATMYDVCEEAGVSTATVSRVINGSPSVAERTRKHVQSVMDRMGYRPNASAQRLAGKTSGMLGVLFPEIDDGFYVQVLRGINAAAKESGKDVLTFFHSPEGNNRSGHSCRAFMERVDAMVVVNTASAYGTADLLLEGRCPAVLIGAGGKADPRFDVVHIDGDLGAEQAMRHLIESGRRDILLLTGPSDNHDSRQRLDGAQRVYKQGKGLECRKTTCVGNFTFQSGVQCMEKHLKSGKAVPDAVFAFNDKMALGAIDVLKRRGIDVPERVAVVGYDDAESAAYAGLTSVHVPMRDIGYEAGRLAIRRIGKADYRTTTRTMHVSLKVRSSSRPSKEVAYVGVDVKNWYEPVGK